MLFLNNMNCVFNNFSAIKYVVFLLGFLILEHGAFSQTKKILSLRESISLAEKNNPELIIAKIEKLKAEAKISEVYADNLIPTVNFNSRYTRNFKKQVFEIYGQQVEIGTDNSISNSFDVTQSIPVLGTPVFSAVRIAEYYATLQDESIRQIETKIKADVTKSYLNLLLLKEIIEVNKNSLINAEENLRITEARYRAGVSTEFEYLRARVKVETIKQQISQSENNLQISKKFFKNIIGDKSEEDIETVGSLEYDSTEVFGSKEVLLNKISTQNISIRQLTISKFINEELNKVDEAGFLPKFYLFGQYSLNAQENDEKDFLKYRYVNSIAAGIGVTWNLNFLRHRYKEDQSYLEIKKSNEQISDVREKLKTQTESILLRMEDAKNRIRVQKETVALSERGLELANISYISGVINQLDVLDAELTLSQVKLSYLQAIYDYLVARTELQQLLEK